MRDASGHVSRRPLGLGIAFAAGVGVSILAAVVLRGPAPDARPPVLAEAPAQADAPPQPAPAEPLAQVAPPAPQGPPIPAAIPTAPPLSPSVATPLPVETRAGAAPPAAAVPLRAPEPTATLTPPGTAQALRPAPRPQPPLPAEAETEAAEEVLPRGLADSPLARPATVAALPAAATRVTLHAPGLTPETEIAAVTQAAATAGFAASLPVPVNFVIASTHVRYYHAADLAAATALAAALPGGPTEPRDFTNAPNLAAPGTLEVWLAGSPRPAAMTRRAARPAAPEPALSPIAVTPLPAAPAAPPPPGPDAISVTPLPPARTAPPQGGVGRQVEGAIRNIERALGNTLDRVTGAP